MNSFRKRGTLKLKHKKVTFRYDRKSKTGLLTVNGRCVRISARKETYNNSAASGLGGYGIHLI